MVNTKKLTLAAVLTALILVIGFTPWLGYIRLGPVSITTLPIPVTVGSIILGWRYGAYFGLLFGVTSLIQCFTGDVLGAICVDANLFLAVVMCVVTRVLMGAAVGALNQLVISKVNNKALSSALASIAGPLLNTVLFVGALVLFFGANSDVTALFGGGVRTIITTLVTINALVEIVACGIVGTAVCTAVQKSEFFEN